MDTVLHASQFVLPLFVTDEAGEVVREIPTLKDMHQLSVGSVVSYVRPLVELGLRAVIVFGVMGDQHSGKNASADCVHDATTPAPAAIAALRAAYPDLLIMADVCLCAYTSHGHCCVFGEDGQGVIDLPRTLDQLAGFAVTCAKAGAQVVAPSDMMDGRIAAIKRGLRKEGLEGSVAVMSYSAKFASCLYGPFRDAAHSAPQFGDRRAYQLPPGSRGLALRALERDVADGADMLMVKPAGSYLDIIRDTRERYPHPLAVYQVSGEYASILAAAHAGVYDLRAAVMESIISLRRAGADIIITYFTPYILRNILPLEQSQ